MLFTQLTDGDYLIRDRDTLHSFQAANPDTHITNLHWIERYLHICLELGEPGKGKGIENHHIVPLGAGGIDDDSNTVYLTKINHFKAHVCLCLAFREVGPFAKAAKLMADTSEVSPALLEPEFLKEIEAANVLACEAMRNNQHARVRFASPPPPFLTLTHPSSPHPHPNISYRLG